MTSPSCCELLRILALCGLLAAAFAAHTAHAQTKDLGNGFRDHGCFAQATTSRGTVCTVDGEGNNVVLVWLFDHRYAYALAVIDAQTGEIEQIPRPIAGDCPFASILSNKGRYYTYMGGHFIEFDPLKREFSFVQAGPARSAMSMTEDDGGVIWAAVYPNADVVSYDPATGQMRDWGPVSTHPSAQYPRAMAADDQGWVYIGIGLAVGQIFMLNPQTGVVTTVVPEDKVAGVGGLGVIRDNNGKVYGYAPVGDEARRWFELHGGQATMLDAEPKLSRKPIIAGSQGLAHYNLPNGERVRNLDLIEGRLVVENPETGQTRELQFHIDGEGGSAMGVAAAPNGTIAGGTYIPSWFFSYDPRTDEWVRRDCYGQWNAVTTQGERFYAASYTEGVLLEWDPAKEWVGTDKNKPESNPRYLQQTYAHPGVGRPYTILAHPDGRHVIYGGTPGYGSTGGGLVFYDTETETAEIISHEQLAPSHSTACQAPLPDGKLLVGTSREPAMGGVRKVDVAELFIMDMETKQVEWREAAIDGVQRYSDLICTAEGMVFGIADRTLLFAFDAQRRQIVHQENLEGRFGLAVHQQGPRIFVPSPDGRIFMLFQKGIAEVDPKTCAVTLRAEPPRAPANGGAYLDGRIYYSTGVNLHSWEVPPAE